MTGIKMSLFAPIMSPFFSTIINMLLPSHRILRARYWGERPRVLLRDRSDGQSATDSQENQRHPDFELRPGFAGVIE